MTQPYRPWVPLVLLVGFTLMVGVVTSLLYQDQQATIEREALNQIEAVAELKATELSRWRAARIVDGRVLAENRSLAESAERLIKDHADKDARQRLLNWLASIRSNPSYSVVALVDSQGVVTGAISGIDASTDNRVGTIARDVLVAGEVELTDLYLDEHGETDMYLVIPLIDSETQQSTIGALVLEIDLEAYLYPYLVEWPIPTDTAETYLVRRDGDDALFLSNLRFAQDAALSLRTPLDGGIALPAMKAALAEEGPVIGLDYRGVEVVADVRSLPDSPWYLVAKMDTSEAYSQANERLLLLLVIAGFSSVSAAGIAALWWRHERALHFKRVLETERSNQAALRESEERFRVIAENVPGGVYLCRDDAAWTMVYVNAGMENLTGVSRADLLSGEVTYASLCHPDDLDDMRAEIDRALQGGTAFHLVYRLTRADGNEVWLEEFGDRIDHEGDSGLLEGVIFDITARKATEAELAMHRENLEQLVNTRTQELGAANSSLDAANEELQCLVEELESSNDELRDANAQLEEVGERLAHANQELERATQAKSRFLANMSHELRTPLNSIIGFAGTIGQGLAGPLTDEQRVQLNMISSSGKHLLGLINDILDLSRVESGKIEVVLERFNLTEMVRDAVELLRPQAIGKNLDVIMSGTDELCEIVSDCGKVRQILLNLLGNAVKFTDHGGVTVRLERRPDGKWAVSVSDTGPGIARGDMHRVFLAFSQIATSPGTKPPGTGLGLAISQDYAHLLGGEILVHSQVGVGTTFTLILPSHDN